MIKLGKNRVAFTAIMGFLVLIVAAGAIFYARGFKPNFKTKSFDRTGLIVATSIPTGAQIFLDGRLTSATNSNINFLEPKTYKVRIEKDGYTTWEKDVDVTADLATEINALLFPQAPEIKPLTTTGAQNPTLSPDNIKIAYGVSGIRGGLYVISMDSSPFNFFQNTKILAKNTSSFDFSKGKFIWSPDSKQVIARFTDENGNATANLILDADKSDQNPQDITASLAATISSWQQQIEDRTLPTKSQIPDSVKQSTAPAQTASPSPSPIAKSTPKTQSSPKPSPSPISLNYFPTGTMFSPDEDKILYKNQEGKYKVYDLKLKKEYTLPDLPDFISISWFPDSKHLIIAQKDLISIIETDGTNKMTVYSGKFDDGFVFANPSGTRLIILTTLAQTEGTPPNLYSINLR